VSVTAAKGFRAAGVTAGLKPSGRPDVALVVNDGAATGAAVFTTNKVQAAPVRLSREVARRGRMRAVALNSGGANACTGAPGRADAEATAEAVAKELGCDPGEVAVASTGLIGVRLDMARLLPGVAAAAAQLTATGGDAAARAVMTTDTVPKQAARTVGYGGSIVTAGGMAKGAGMLAPALATMLVVLTTDADVASDHLRFALKQAVQQTFDRIDSDGCMSTNDTVLLLSSGASGIEPTPAELTSAVTAACADLAGQLLADAEGATKDIAIEVTGAVSEADAVEVGRSIARNNLVKTAFFGNDPNWGRILAAIGTTVAVFEPDEVDVAINGVRVCKGGAAGEDRSKVDLSGRAVTVGVDLHAGDQAATIWTNDLSLGYVHENSAYST
jgi:glutamate N-acetyltransferase/amino-acid N-acetyltransferase